MSRHPGINKPAMMLVLTIVATLVLGLVLFIAQPRRQDTTAAGEVKKEDIVAIVKDYYPKPNDGGDPVISVNNITPHQDRWLFTAVSKKDEPLNSKLRYLIYIIEVNEDNSLKVVAFTNDFFQEGNFPSGTPDHLIKRAVNLYGNTH